MKLFFTSYLFTTLLLFFLILSCKNNTTPSDITISIKNENSLQNNFIFIEINSKIEHLEMFWKNKSNLPYSNFKNLKQQLKQKNKTLTFAMNGGMYLKDQSPQGLYIENGVVLSKLDTTQIAYGNFYMQPNGIFYLTQQNEPFVVKSELFKQNNNVKYATQSGPMLLIDGKFHPKFKKDSKSKFVRNGVGVLPNGNAIFCMSKNEINFYNFAKFFKDKGCENALYLDGFVSRTYLPEKNQKQLDGNFGVIIGAWEMTNNTNE